MDGVFKGVFWLMAVLLPGGLIAGLLGTLIEHIMYKKGFKEKTIRYSVLGGMLAFCILFIVVLAILVSYAA
jgi:hypothetical protein